MTRGALVLFVGLFSVIFLHRHLGGWKWVSLFIVVAGVALVGLAGVLEKGAPSVPGVTDPNPDVHENLIRNFARAAISSLETHTPAETILGVTMIAGAQIFTASQFVLEESIMERYSMEPIQVVGWEGVFGFLVTLLGTGVLHLAVGRTPQGHGGYFDAREGFHQIFTNRAIAVTSLMIMVSIG
jgi:drug/metabolite transporter (DMT)-like permease